MRFLHFLRAVFKYWGSLVTGGGAIGVLSLWQTGGHPVNPWVYGTISIGGLLVASYRAWQDQVDSVSELTGQNVALEQKYFDDRPRLAILVSSVAGVSAWRAVEGGQEQAPSFALQHLEGRPATAVRIDPVPSLRGELALRFVELPFVAGDAPVPIEYEVWEGNGAIRPNMHVIEKIGWGAMLLSFLRDSPPNMNEYVYPVFVWFKDRDTECLARFSLIVDVSTFSMRAMPYE